MTVMAAPAITRISDEAYFELELRSPAKHQLWRGELFAMAGGSPAHNVISVNVSSVLRIALRGRASVARGRTSTPTSSWLAGP
jgi:hypothetical protein